jgi:putative endonuclease
MADRVLSRRTALGQRAEQLAADHLERLGYEIFVRNWRRPEGEIDLVVVKAGLYVFVEVRSRTGVERGHALETIDGRKRARVLRAARMFIDEEKPQAEAFRFDVIAVTFSLDETPPELIHIEDAFQTSSG